jgi:hypothetical protein
VSLQKPPAGITTLAISLLVRLIASQRRFHHTVLV